MYFAKHTREKNENYLKPNDFEPVKLLIKFISITVITYIGFHAFRWCNLYFTKIYILQ